jgi:hypothetical protein
MQETELLGQGASATPSTGYQPKYHLRVIGRRSAGQLGSGSGSEGEPMDSHLIQLGMRTAIRDVQDYLDCMQRHNQDTVDAKGLRAYLLALLITAGAYDDLADSMPFDFDTDDITDGES